jgi:hypothetical protein
MLSPLSSLPRRHEYAVANIQRWRASPFIHRRAQLEDHGVTFRVSAELVQLVSPTPEPARSAGWVTFDSLAPNAGRIEVASRRRGKSTRHRDGF